VSGEDKQQAGAEGSASGKAGGGKPESAWTGLLKEGAKQLLPILLTGASLIGFVAFAGAVIVWTRFYAIEVPPDQAVKAVPQSELVATGSSVLLLFGFFGVLAIVAAYLVDRRGRATPGMSRALLALLAVEGVTAIFTFDENWDTTAIVTVVVFVLLVLLALLLTFNEFVARYADELESRPNETLDPLRGPGPLRRKNGELRAPIGELRALFGSLLAVLALIAVLIFAPSDRRLGFALAAAVLVALLLSYLEPWIGGRKVVRSVRSELRARHTAANQERKKREDARQEREDAWEKRLEKCGEAWEPPETKKGTRLQRAGDSALWLFGVVRGTKIEKPRPKSREELEREHEAECEKLRKEDRRARRRPHRLRIAPTGAVLLALIAGFAVVLPCAIIGIWWLAVPLGAAMVLGLGVWRIAVLSKPSFMWFGLAVFISVPLFGTITLMAHNIAEPQVQPLALIRISDNSDEAIQGIYVTEGSDRIYFANVATEGCTEKLVPDSGRLLWVPKSEVVAMSVGPLQGIGDVGKSALEMAYALTPSVETPAAGAVSLTVPEEKSKKIKEAEEKRLEKELEAHAPQLDQRLENPGPAVRPTFGSGLSLVPEIASPGEEVELRLSVPNDDVGGFGTKPHGHTLRLNGIPLAPIREATRNASRAEFVKTKGGVVLRLDKLGAYGDDDEEFHRLPEGSTSPPRRFVKLKDSRVKVLNGASAEKYLPLNPTKERAAELASGIEVSVEKGEPEELEPALLRQAWHPNRIRFRVPDAATSGVVTVECDQLAGSPLLRVSHSPTARIAVRMQANSTGVKLDSRGSRDDNGKKITRRRWTIEGLGRGHREQISTRLPPRLGAYAVKLTVTDKAGNSDTAELRLLRLPTSLFNFGKSEPEHEKQIAAAAEALKRAVQAHLPLAIELDGHTDHPGSLAYNMKLSLERDDRVHEKLLRDWSQKTTQPPLPVREVAYGETCPIDPRPGRRSRNRRVDVFVLDEGVSVKPPKGCIPGRLKNTTWHPPPPAEDKTSSNAKPTTSSNGGTSGDTSSSSGGTSG
jgi:outer membrane protein OmpA-like peptidoglycan-associated protein/Ca2+/Na+ antiporter